MPVVADVAFASTNSSTITDDTWVSLVGGPLSVMGLGNVIQMSGYVLNLHQHDRVRFVIDGTEVVKAPPEFPLMYNQVLTIGTHTVDFQARSLSESEVAGPRGFTVLDLGLVTP